MSYIATFIGLAVGIWVANLIGFVDTKTMFTAMLFQGTALIAHGVTSTFIFKD